MRVYLAGPMRGIPKFNFPAFHKAAKKLRKQGYTVFSPAEKVSEKKILAMPSLQEDMAFRRKVFAMDLTWICKHAEAVALMPGWKKSKGARAEKAAAEAIGLEVFFVK